MEASEADDAEYVKKMDFINDNLMKRTLAVRGTITGEHGVSEH